MKIVCIGGGPAGLYFALLMKQQDPRHEIAVVERNKPYDTFGWGVVFSDQTMENLRANDPVSADAIEAASKRLVFEVVLSEDKGGFKFGQSKIPADMQARFLRRSARGKPLLRTWPVRHDRDRPLPQQQDPPTGGSARPCRSPLTR